MKTGTNSGAVKGGRSGKLPVKRSINLAAAGVKKMNITGAVIGIVLHAVTAFLLTRERKHNSVAGTPTAFWLSTALSLVTAIGGVIVMQVEDDLFDNVAAFFGAALMLVEGIILLYPVLR